MKKGHQPKQRFILAVDIGGTKVEAGLVSGRGKVIASERRPMRADGSAREGLLAVQNAIDAAMRHPPAKNVRAIGVAVPGWLDSKAGTVLRAANLPCWRNYPLAAKLAALYGLPVRIENDASAAAAAEAKWGSARRFENFFYVSLGTGIGTGIVWRDDRGVVQIPSSEGGHTTIDFQGPLCPCGKKGCIEMYASGKALARRANALIAKHSKAGSALAKLAKSSFGGMNTELLHRAAKAGNKLAAQILEEGCIYLAIWLGNIIDLLEPEAIVFGGGLGRAMLSYAPRLRRELTIHAVHPHGDRVPLIGAQFGSQSALLGAAALWSED